MRANEISQPPDKLLKYPEDQPASQRVVGRCRQQMDRSMRMVVIAGVLMLALLIAIVGSVSADSVKWQSLAVHAAAADGHRL
jgi:hypothetical protein